MTGAAQHLRHAKGLDPMITAAKSGLPVDITKVTNTFSSAKYNVQDSTEQAGVQNIVLGTSECKVW